MSSAYRSHLKESILIVDSAPEALRGLTGQLAERGYQVQFASSGRFALKLAQAKPPALILLEVNLPDGSGYQVCQIFKADRRTRDIPIVVLSTLTATEAKVEAFRAGGVDYIVKPFALEEVLIRLETHLNTQRLRQQLIEQNLQLQRETAQHEQAERLLEQQLKRTGLLQQVTAVLQSEADSQITFEAAVAQIGRVLQVSRAALHIYVPPPMPEIPLIAEYVETGYGSLRQIDFTLADSLFIPELLTADRAIAAVDVYRDPRLQSIQELCRAAEIQSLLAIRTSYRNQPNGVLILQQCQPRVWTEEEVGLVEAMAVQIGIALAQVKSLEQEQKQLEALGYQNLILRQEICERRQVELALQESEAELRGLFAAMVDVVLILDRQGRYLRIAPTSPHNLYKPATELLGKTLHQVFSPTQAELFLSHIQTSLELCQTVDFEYSLVIQGETVWFNAKISPVGEDTVISVARDITARKQTEAELLHKTKTLSKFSTNLKHLHRLSLTDFATVEDLCADYLKTGCEILRFSSGLIGQVNAGPVSTRQDGASRCRLLAVHSNLPLAAGQAMEIQRTYHQRVLHRRQTFCSTGVAKTNTAKRERVEHVDQQIGQQVDQQVNQQIGQLTSQLTSQLSTYIGTPIWVDGEIFGWLCFFASEPRPEGYQNHEPEIIELMAQSIGKFISSHRVMAKRQQAEEAVQLLLNITQAMTAAPDFNQALYAALSALCAATGWIYGEVWLPSADRSVLECSPVWYCNQEGQPATAIAAVKQLRQSLESVTFQPNQGIAGRVWSRQQPEWTMAEEMSFEGRTPAPEPLGSSGQAVRLGEHGQYRFQLVNHYGIKARLGVPITVTTDGSSVESPPSNRSTVLAVLVFFTAEARHQDEQLIQLVSAVATQLGTVLAQKQAAAELQALFTAMNDGVLVRDAAGRCLKVASMNSSFEQPALRVLGKTLHDTLPKPAADLVLRGIQTSLSNRSTVTLEYNLPLANRQVCLSASISPLSADTVLIVERDISDRKQTEEALARRERYLAALVAVQRALLAFRTPASQDPSANQHPSPGQNPSPSQDPSPSQNPLSSQHSSPSQVPSNLHRDSQDWSNQGQDRRYQEILRILGRISAASHVYIYANQRRAGQLQLKLWARWDAAGAAATGMPPHLYRTHARWAERLNQGVVVSGSTASFPAAEQAMLQEQGILAILLLPLMVNGKFWGFIGFDDCTTAEPWDALEISLLRTAASAIALHHERSLIENALRQSARREQATLRVIERMRQTLDIEQIFHTTVVELQALLQCDRVLIYRFNPDWSGEVVAETVAQGWISVMSAAETGSLFTHVNAATNPGGRTCVLTSWSNEAWSNEAWSNGSWDNGAGAPEAQLSGMQSYLSRDTYLQDTQGGAYSQGAKYLCVPDVQQAGLAACYLELLEQLQAKAYLTVPIFRGQRLWGLLAAYQNTGPRDWQPSEIRLVTHISTQFGVALQQSELLAQTQRQSAALEKAKDAAEAASRAKTQFLAHMSHELRTPLNSILGFTQLMSQDAALGQEHQNYLQIVNRSGQHLLELINEVLEVARLEANRTDLQISRFDLYELLSDLDQMLRLAAAEKRLHFSIEVAPAVPRWLTSDRSKLRQVLLNLLDNAIKFTQAGSVSLRVMFDANGQGGAGSPQNPELDPTRLQPSSQQPSSQTLARYNPSSAGRIRIQVQDTGFGIAAEEMDLLFEAFVQTEAGRQSNQGNGLGLVICHRFVQLMGGDLRVQSKIGKGSIFEFDLPLRDRTFSLPTELQGLAPPTSHPASPGIRELNQLSPAIYAQTSDAQLTNAQLTSAQLTSAQAANAQATEAKPPITADLSQMPLEWIQRLQQAARGCSERQVLQLIQDIPVAQAQLAQQLSDLVYNFHFEAILELTQLTQ